MDISLVLLISSLFAGGYIFAKVLHGVHRYKYTKVEHPIPQAHLPTVSVCIPARNEMYALAACLERVLASDYEKLEILVLDDSSTDNTPNIIRSFARSGVRFVPGKPLPDGWLGKNQALATLAEEASGDYLLFLDVDTHLSYTAISQLVAEAEFRDAAMLSVLPRRNDGLRASALFGTARHMWELVLQSHTQPPSSSSAWLVDRKKLIQLEKGLATYGMSVRPDQHIAKAMTADNSYRFYIGSSELGVSIEKRYMSQIETAERLYYPMLGRSMAGVTAALVVGALLLAPWLYVMSSYYYLAIAALAVVWVGFVVFNLCTYGKNGLLLRVVVWPYVLLQDSALLVVSTIRYATHSVVWKGRNVTAKASHIDAVSIDE